MLGKALATPSSIQNTRLPFSGVPDVSHTHSESEELTLGMDKRPLTIIGCYDEISTTIANDARKRLHPLLLPQSQSPPPYRSFSQQAPATILETSASFRPETYTDRNAAPTFWSHYSREVHATAYTRVYNFGMFISKAPSQWTRVTMCLSTSVDSRYWDLERMTTYGLSGAEGAVNMPASLVSMLERSLRSYEHLEQDSHVIVHLGKELEMGKVEPASKQPVLLTESSFEVKTYLREITNKVYHLNCPRYIDRELIQRRPISRRRTTNVFIAYLQNRWVLESRFGSDKSQIDSNLYILKVLHCLREAPGINPFVGVVLDEDTGIINAFLCELPAKGKLCSMINEANNRGQPIPWKRREAWCKQIVQSVAEMHSKGFVTGYFGEAPCSGVAIDANDNAVLYGRFRTRFPYTPDRLGILPPEYRSSATSGCSFDALFHTDIYQLGLLLWRIAANTNAVLRSRFCKLVGCSNTSDSMCAEPHADPVQLPSPGEHVPHYFMDIINACRTELPEGRASAWELVQMFPHTTECGVDSTRAGAGNDTIQPTLPQGVQSQDTTCTTPATTQTIPLSRSSTKHNTQYLTRPEECLAKYDSQINCDRCAEAATSHSFHCDVCSLADYDLCRRCFSKGLHCLDKDHKLRERGEGLTEERLYSHVKENRQRDVVIL